MRKLLISISGLLIIFLSYLAISSLISTESKEEARIQPTDYINIWHWEDEFSKEEKLKLTEWIETVSKATYECLGRYQFDVHYYFHRSEADHPVPFGHTTRKKLQGVHFYVNPNYSLAEFLSDWTAPHEISHLSICFLGKKGKWFSEGYATYLSRKIMINMGYITSEEFDQLYFSKINQHSHLYQSTSSSFIMVSDSLFKAHRYGPVYWASSGFFLLADKAISTDHGIVFTDLVKEYQKNCRIKDRSLKSIITSYDKLTKSNYFSRLMKAYRNETSFEVIKKIQKKS